MTEFVKIKQLKGTLPILNPAASANVESVRSMLENLYWIRGL